MADTENFNRACERLGSDALFNLIDKQTDLVHFRNVDQFAEGNGDDDEELKAATNEEVWAQFVTEEIDETQKVVLEEFHLFDWFPLAPGKFHTDGARNSRQFARNFLEVTSDGEVYYNPTGKGMMIAGGLGTVRLLPRQIAGEQHHFMTASSTGACHEGFPVLVPHKLYKPLKAQMRKRGVAAATIRGEMRYLPEELRTLFGSNREIPLLYLHVDELLTLTEPRRGVKNFEVSVAVSFRGTFQGEEDTYVTFATFDPTIRGDKMRACQWIDQFYVTKKYQGVVLTDFDEARPAFPAKRFSLNIGRSRPVKPHPKAKFSLEDLMSGRFNLQDALATADLPPYVMSDGKIHIFNVNYQRQIHTEGGAYVEGNVNTGGGKFVGRADK